MKYILTAFGLLFSAGLFAQNPDVALNSVPNTVESYSPPSDDTILGEFNEKSKKSHGLGKDAYYFENTMGEGVALKSFLFKVDDITYNTKVYVRLYEKKEYKQDLYVENDTISYASYIPGDAISTKEIIVNIEPGQKGVVEVDLSVYDVTMPQDGLFVSLELKGYFDAKGNAVTKLKSKNLTRIDFHPTTTENYCGWAEVQGQEGGFWMNRNKWTKADFKYSFKKEPSKSILIAPNFGLKVARK